MCCIARSCQIVRWYGLWRNIEFHHETEDFRFNSSGFWSLTDAKRHRRSTEYLVVFFFIRYDIIHIDWTTHYHYVTYPVYHLMCKSEFVPSKADVLSLNISLGRPASIVIICVILIGVLIKIFSSKDPTNRTRSARLNDLFFLMISRQRVFSIVGDQFEIQTSEMRTCVRMITSTKFVEMPKKYVEWQEVSTILSQSVFIWDFMTVRLRHRHVFNITDTAKPKSMIFRRIYHYHQIIQYVGMKISSVERDNVQEPHGTKHLIRQRFISKLCEPNAKFISIKLVDRGTLVTWIYVSGLMICSFLVSLPITRIAEEHVVLQLLNMLWWWSSCWRNFWAPVICHCIVWRRRIFSDTSWPLSKQWARGRIHTQMRLYKFISRISFFISGPVECRLPSISR